MQSEADKESSILRARIQHLEMVISLMHKTLWNIKPYVEFCLNMKAHISSVDHEENIEIIGRLLQASKTRSAFEEALLEVQENKDESVYVAGGWTPRWCLKPQVLP